MCGYLWQAGQIVSGYIQLCQFFTLAQLLRKPRQLVVSQVYLRQPCEMTQLNRKFLQLIVHHAEVLKVTQAEEEQV